MQSFIKATLTKNKFRFCIIIKKTVREIFNKIERGSFVMVTLKCSCEYFDELKAFDEIILEMRLSDIDRNKIKMDFDYYKVTNSNSKLVAKGNQEISCMKKEMNRLSPIDVPDELRKALIPFLND